MTNTKGTTMTTRTIDTDTLRAKAEAAAIKAAEAQRLVDEADDKARAEAEQAQTDRDRATADNYSVRALDQHVNDTLTALEDAVRDWPVTQALAAHLAAINARSWAYVDATQALERLGRNTAGMTPPSTVQPNILDILAAAAGRLAQDATDAARADQEQ